MNRITGWGLRQWTRSASDEYPGRAKPARKFCYQCMEYGHSPDKHGKGKVVVPNPDADLIDILGSM